MVYWLFEMIATLLHCYCAIKLREGCTRDVILLCLSHLINLLAKLCECACISCRFVCGGCRLTALLDVVAKLSARDFPRRHTLLDCVPVSFLRSTSMRLGLQGLRPTDCSSPSP